MTFTLPYPPSTNNLYGTGTNGRRFLKSEGKAFKATSAAMALAAGVRPIAGDVSVTVDVYRPAKRGDLDNTLKSLLDSLKGVAWADDSQVTQILARRHDTDRHNPRAVVTIAPIPREEQADGR